MLNGVILLVAFSFFSDCRTFPSGFFPSRIFPSNPNHKLNHNSNHNPNTNPNSGGTTLSLLTQLLTIALTEQGRGNVRGGIAHGVTVLSPSSCRDPCGKFSGLHGRQLLAYIVSFCSCRVNRATLAIMDAYSDIAINISKYIASLPVTSKPALSRRVTISLYLRSPCSYSSDWYSLLCNLTCVCIVLTVFVIACNDVVKLYFSFLYLYYYILFVFLFIFHKYHIFAVK